MNNRKQHLLEKFILKTCTNEELQELLLFFQEEDVEDFSEIFRSNWENPVIPDKEKGIDWNEKFSMIMEQAKSETPVISAKEGIRTKIYRGVFRATIAAAVIFAVFVGVRFINNGNKSEPQTVKNEIRATIKMDTIMPVLVHGNNSTDKVLSSKLPDGSLIELYPNSQFTYKEPVERNRRDIVLSGKAYFKVAKDKTRPFTVYSEDISTTALGTQFTVTSILHAKQIRVRLYEGKVVIKSINLNRTSRMKDVYLTPNFELLYDKNKHTGIVNSFSSNRSAGKTGIKSVDSINSPDPEVPKYGRLSWMMFNNQPLDEIFNQLSGIFNVKINYSKRDINKMYFIGTFAKTDSVEYILKQIGDINNLIITKSGNAFYVQKK
jgi:transmembrane sensor